jgi:putative ABC transport system substrate-binding protein
VQAAAQSIGRQVHVATASSEAEFDPAFAGLMQQQIGGLLVAADPFFFSQRGQLIALAARYALPAIYEWREFADIPTT